jgi:predicted ArsR family transcriptional regulator
MSLIASFGPAQDKLLYELKRRGPLPVKTLADTMSMTSMGVRQHLQLLEQEGLVTQTAPVPGRGRGRPTRLWKLTGAGHGRFPDAHARITTELIDSIRDALGEDALDALIDKRGQQVEAEYCAQTAGLAFTQRAEVLRDLRQDEGYMAEIETLADGSVRLIENHCPICVAATSCQGFCRSELSTFQRVFDDMATVVRDDHLLSGARRCSYLISPTTTTSIASTDTPEADDP